MDEAKEVKIPATLLIVALAMFVAFGFWAAGAAGVGIMLKVVAINLVVGVALAIGACFITAKIMGITFGSLGTAALKLAAIFAFAGAVAVFIPTVGWLIALVLYLALLAWLFELEPLEVAVCAAVIWAMRFLAGILVAGLFASH